MNRRARVSRFEPMIAVALGGGLVVSAVVGAACLRLPGVSSTLLAAYVLFFGAVTTMTTLLSPFRAVTRAGLGVAVVVIVIATIVLWLALGRPRPSTAVARATARDLFRDPVTLVFACVVTAVLGYEFLLVVTAPPNNWDSLAYHLPRVVAWVQHHGVYWIPHAPTDRMNEFQPLAEQQILFLFVAAGRGALFAAPQFFAQVSILLSVFTSARRLGYEPRLAACAALFFATFTLVALEATTAQNDLVVASLVSTAATFLLGRTRTEVALAGVAIALALGVKLTAALAIPVLVVLALLRGRRALGVFGTSALLCFVAIAMWGFVRNAVATGHILGRGGGRVEESAHAAVAGLLETGYRVTYGLFDLSGFGPWTVSAMVVAAIGVMCCGGLFLLRRSPAERGKVPLELVLASVVLLAPVVVIVVSLAAREAGRDVGLPINDPAFTFTDLARNPAFDWHINTRVNEDRSAFGAIGGLAIVCIPLFVLGKRLRRRIDPRLLVLAAAVPVYVVLLALTAKYNPWLSRFLMVPVALTAPLFAELFRKRGTGLAVVAVASLTVSMAHIRNERKPLDSAPMPWSLSQTEALDLTFGPRVARASAELNRLVPTHARLGAIVGPQDPTYVLYGPQLRRRVTFLAPLAPAAGADRARLDFVVVRPSVHRNALADLQRDGWTLEPLSTFWTLAVRGPASTP